MAYNKKTWTNLPSTDTPINADGMNDLETRVKALDTSIMDMIGLATTTTKSIPNNLRINGANFNEIEGTGLFIAFGPCTNVPMYEGLTTNHWYLIQIEYNNDYRFQMIQRLAGGGNDTFTRIKVGGTWQSWASRNPDNYSTSEVKIGTWGGKPLYRKVIQFGRLPNATTKSVSTGLTNVAYTNINGYATDGTYYWALNSPRPSAGNAYGIGCYINNNSIIIETGTDKSSYTAYVTIEYTKNTD